MIEMKIRKYDMNPSLFIKNVSIKFNDYEIFNSDVYCGLENIFINKDNKMETEKHFLKVDILDRDIVDLYMNDEESIEEVKKYMLEDDSRYLFEDYEELYIKLLKFHNQIRYEVNDEEERFEYIKVDLKKFFLFEMIYK